jgi:hypothetical protein
MTFEITLKIIGIIGGAAFAFAAVPAAITTIKAGKTIGTPITIAWAIFTGCILLYTYLTGSHGFDLIVTGTYGIETASWATIIWFHYWPRAP